MRILEKKVFIGIVGHVVVGGLWGFCIVCLVWLPKGPGIGKPNLGKCQVLGCRVD